MYQQDKIKNTLRRVNTSGTLKIIILEIKNTKIRYILKRKPLRKEEGQKNEKHKRKVNRNKE